MKTVLMFSGQGSQYFHMGRALYASDPIFKEHLDLSFEILKDYLPDPSNTLFDPLKKKSDPFQNLLQTHPLLFSIQLALGKTLLHHGLRPDLLLGYSLGELVAETLAGVLTGEAALRFSVFQAEAVESGTEPALMIAALEAAENLGSVPPFAGRHWAGRNFSKHSVWTFPREVAGEAQRVLAQRGISHQVLPVERGFHSPMILPAREAVVNEAGGLQRNAPGTPIFSAFLGRRLETEWRSSAHEWDVLEGPVDFQGAIQNLESEGPWHYIDAGPSGTLANFVKYLLPKPAASKTSVLMTPYGREVTDLPAFIKEVLSDRT
ncbi:MAG: acyltransferase domain-containing protein [Spirochaetia bacterium]|nr:acyltransferase domain-containing protein [Spirochaetia bacterium]